MITLIVGVPGSGKTWYAVEKLIPSLLKNKPVCYTNIRAHTDAKETFGFDDDFTDSRFDNALVVLDEVQFFSLRDTRGEFFQHLTIHRHTGRDYIFITQSVAAIPRKWQGLIEKTIEISSIAGSQFSRARFYQGLPKRANPVLAEEKFKPRATDKYKTTEEGVDETKRKVPWYVWKMALAMVGVCVATVALGYYGVNRVVKPAEAKSNIQQIQKSPVSLSPENQASRSKAASALVLVVDNSERDTNLNAQLDTWPLSLDSALTFLDEGFDPIRKCNDRTFTDNPDFNCNSKSRKLSAATRQSFRRFEDQAQSD